jgi:hypothetical protein
MFEHADDIHFHLCVVGENFKITLFFLGGRKFSFTDSKVYQTVSGKDQNEYTITSK